MMDAEGQHVDMGTHGEAMGGMWAGESMMGGGMMGGGHARTHGRGLAAPGQRELWHDLYIHHQ